VITKPQNEEAKARYRVVKIQPRWVVTPRKQQQQRMNKAKDDEKDRGEAHEH
jgi:hypothetical protein